MAVLIYGVIQSALLSFVLLLIGLKNPRMMLQDYPKSIKNAVPPKTQEEKRLGRIYGAPFILIFIIYPIFAAWREACVASLLEAFLFIWAIMMFSNLYDLLILDWLVMCTITPRWMVLPGTEGNRGYKDYYFHFVGFLKGIVITAVLSLVSALTLRFIIENIGS